MSWAQRTYAVCHEWRVERRPPTRGGLLLTSRRAYSASKGKGT
jgi:hypothetical protein